MMVGEIRDLETAQVAIQSALTGHMILSTLHTNTAASSVTRLLDMGVEPFLITSTLNAVLAQRLVRRLCPQCRTVTVLSREAIQSLGLDAAAMGGMQFYKPHGCGTCGNTGFRGRIALLNCSKWTTKFPGSSWCAPKRAKSSEQPLQPECARCSPTGSPRRKPA